MAQAVKCLLCKLKDLSSTPSTHKKSGHGGTLVVAVPGRPKRREELKGFLVSKCSLICELQVPVKDAVSYNKMKQNNTAYQKT